MVAQPTLTVVPTLAEAQPTQTVAPPTFPHLSQLAPFSGSIPTIPAIAVTSGKFVNFNELLYMLEVGAAEDTPVHIELGEDNRLTLPKKNQKTAGLLLCRLG